MITAVDANIILDILVGTPLDAEISSEALRRAKLSGQLITSAICYAEVSGNFSAQKHADDFFQMIGCEIEAIDKEIAFLASVFYRSYRKRGGDRSRILPDFMVAAHAQLRADRLLTRDKRFYGPTFPKLKTVSAADISTERSSKK